MFFSAYENAKSYIEFFDLDKAIIMELKSHFNNLINNKFSQFLPLSILE